MPADVVTVMSTEPEPVAAGASLPLAGQLSGVAKGPQSRLPRGDADCHRAAEKIGRNPETVRRWIRSGRLPARRVGRRHEIAAKDLHHIEDELFPMAELPEEWKVGDDGSPAPNWVAAIHRSRSGH